MLPAMAEEFVDRDLRGASFTRVDLREAVLRDVWLDGVRMRGVWAGSLDVDGDVGRLVYNGIDLIPLWREAMLREHPEFGLLTPDDAAGYRAVWPLLVAQWADTVARARRLPEELLHESVAGEWSFVQTLRHLCFATEAWVLRALGGDPAPYGRWSLPFDEMEPVEGMAFTWSRDERAPLEEVLAQRASRQQAVSAALATLTDADLATTTTPVVEPGYPESEAFAVPRVLRAVLNEEFWHRQFALRDLAVLEARLAGSAP
jgi:uncharacterized damage-inducible protein DinB